MHIRIFILFFLLAISNAYAEPFDAVGAELLVEVKAALQKSDESLPESLTQKLLNMANNNHDNEGIISVVAYGLAYANDAQSLQLLEKLKKQQNELISGVASWAIVLRSTSDLSPSQKFGMAAYSFGKATNPYSRIMFAQWLPRKFAENALPVLMSALVDEKNKEVRLALAIQLASSSNMSICQKTLQIIEKEDVIFFEGTAFFMRTISESKVSSTAEVRGIIEKKLVHLRP